MLQNLDPAMLKTIGSLFQEYNRGDDEKAALLQALHPFLREERWTKVEKAIQITRLSRVIPPPPSSCSGSAAMYNRYIPQEGYAPVEPAAESRSESPAAAGTPPPSPFSPPCWEVVGPGAVARRAGSPPVCPESWTVWD